jgi:hypothetical protein
MGFARFVVQPHIDVDEADHCPCKVGPPKNSRQLCEQNGKSPSVDIIGPVRRNSYNEEHKTHAGEEQDLYNQASCGAVTALQMPDADTGNAEDVEQDERR